MPVANYKDYIHTYLTKTCRYNEAVTCGIMANIYKESAYSPINLQQTGEKKLGMTDEEYTEAVNKQTYTLDKFKGDGFGYGLIQWTYHSRKEALWKRTVKKGISIGDISAQLAYMSEEMRGYTKLMDAIKSAKNTKEDAYNIAYAMCTIYEQPANMVERGKERGAFAKELFTEYTAFKPYLVKITKKSQKVRSGPGVKYSVNMKITDKGTYTIVDEGGAKKAWGRLKSGAGWIYLPYAKKL